MVKKLSIIIIILSSILFYNFTFLGKFSKLLELMGIGLIIALIIFYGIYDNSFRFRHHFTPFMLIIFIALPFSMLIADKFHNQSISVSLYAQSGIYFYLLYFLLHQLKLKPEEFEKIFLYFGIIFIFFYLLQYFLYPRIILFDARITHERGTIRIFLSGMEYLIIGYFLSLKNFLEKRRLRHTLILLASLIIIIFIGSRTLLSTIGIASLLYLILSRRIKSRFWIYLLSTIGVILIYFTFQNIFQELITTALYKDPISRENIRFRAVRYFLSTLFPNTLAYLFGNGASTGQSEYSHTMGMISARYGFYLTDIGLIGDYVKYGVLFVIGVLGILIKVFTIKIHSDYIYIKYFYAFTALATILGGGFGDSGFIVLVCITLYMIDVAQFYVSDKENPDAVQEDELDGARIITDDKTELP
jgi:hypothetical protein